MWGPGCSSHPDVVVVQGSHQWNYTPVNGFHWVLNGTVAAELGDSRASGGRRNPQVRGTATVRFMVDAGAVGTVLNLKQVAAELGVHYMTAYRYARTGQLDAEKVGTAWVVEADAVRRFQAQRTSGASGATAEPDGDRADRPDRIARLVRALAAGDEPMAWRVIQQALSSGHSPSACYLELLVPALRETGADTDLPADVATETPGAYLATATAARLVARLGARFRRPGRSRGTVVFGAPRGEHHSLPIAIVADLVRLEGFTCLELGADVPPEVFAHAAEHTPRLIAVGVGATTAANLDAVTETIAAIGRVAPDTPVVVGGQAVCNPEIAELAGATRWAADGAEAVRVIVGLASARR